VLGNDNVSIKAEEYMNVSDIMGLVAGALQLTVAGYTLRLTRLFGSARVGWSLFLAFLLLALLHLVQSAASLSAPTRFGIEINVAYSIISLLLLVGMIHMETVQKERRRVEREEQRMKAQLELEVEKKTEYLTRAISELQTEMDERKRMESEVETAHGAYHAVSRRAEMAQIANNVLRSVAETLKSVNTSADLVSNQVKQSRKHPAAEQAVLLKELESIKANLEKIATMQRDYAALARENAAAKTDQSIRHLEYADTVATA
jgi:C4-dicarboxylate-specific signal transduction histidine kinase